MSSQKVTTAIFPIAGLGTRFLPATKSIPKEILTLVDKPLIQYAVEEAREAGIHDFIFVTSRGKGALEDFFDVNHSLERALRKAGKTELLAALEATNLDSGHVAYVRQHEALGLGHAVWCAHRLVGKKPFAVILPDDMVVADRPCLSQMIEAHEEVGGTIVATMEVPPEKASSYGILDVEETRGALIRPRGIVEKPKAGTAPSNFAVIGRYILAPAIMHHLNRKKVGAGGEIQLTDAIAHELADNPGSVHGFRFQGERFDCGSKAGFLQATVALALQREDLRDEFAEFLEAIAPHRGLGAQRAATLRSVAAAG
ncbi:UTP--glucose-1-phosphate uridylyltransferase [Cereibacter sphaeroides]|uniref:UTP--glucose-1-phosphate uridylyltransferase n=1 Tax=Rhodobacterales TaxID=204455 RepID=UPI000BBF35BD|nr:MULTISPECIES: UTP--glucose-1-phosphate uridylyltransferase [Paracoccaceae]MCE6953339.1 UTP--glucose-1-phosphate uridylyltransferase [Cereibacter sphaeroides]MCE6960320.1 UTP--glucose-1-phosphate uridylyltransferase [Cereibacter sphaeroides]MCE6969269.1 UTP--glucose-1-phosphate uridylyltransferase [Cereibacter sphaeroides]MCE6975328.1 UTP--glucose-1-phosphate uridylyltransferase [Cereibacter sphaeroides]